MRLIGQQMPAIPEIAEMFEVTGVVTALRSREKPRSLVARALQSFAAVAGSANAPTF